MKYEFKTVDGVGLINVDVNSLSRNLSLSLVDSIGTRWHVEEGKDSLLG